MTHRDRLIAFLATLLAIVVLSIAGALVVMSLPNTLTDIQIAKAKEALGFIGLAITGLATLIGTFRPQQRKDEE